MSQDLNAICLIIPAYDPDAKLLVLIDALRAKGFGRIVVVNDGSGPQSQAVFAQLGAPVQLLTHPVNRGKGAALKTAFAHVAQSQAQGAEAAACRYVITLDADGQHLPEDVLRMARAALAQQEQTTVLLGARSMPPEAPLRSRLGNALTRWVFGKLAGQRISDTQTGLRGFPIGLLAQLQQLPGERYEYEMHMLAHLVKQQVPLRELPIAAVYIEDNASSHFNPLTDSLRIYWVLLKDLLLGACSLALDVLLFMLLLRLSQQVFFSVVVARVLSALFNFAGNRFFVFRGQHLQPLLAQLLAYAALAIALMLASASLVHWLVHSWQLPPLPAKLGVDALLYAISFTLRRSWLFRVRRSAP